MEVKQVLDLQKWNADPSQDFAEAYSALIPEIMVLASICGISLEALDLKSENEIQALYMTIAWDDRGDLEQLSKFVGQVWGAVDRWNHAGGHVGVGYVTSTDSQGRDVVSEVEDFVIGYGGAHSDVGYMAEGSLPPATPPTSGAN